jgi:hypothetical protein
MKRILTLTVAAAMVALVQPAQATTTTATYVAFGRASFSQTVQGTNYGVGGYSFPVATGDPSTLRIVDASGAGTPVLICQESGAAEDAPGTCQDGQFGQVDGDDIVQKLCATGSPQALRTQFTSGAGKTLAVFVNVADPLTAMRPPVCSGVGTTGTLTLTF